MDESNLLFFDNSFAVSKLHTNFTAPNNTLALRAIFCLIPVWIAGIVWTVRNIPVTGDPAAGILVTGMSVCPQLKTQKIGDMRHQNLTVTLITLIKTHIATL